MTKRSAITLGLAALLGLMTSTIGFAVSPGVLRVTGPVLCDSGTDFVVSEGPTVELPDQQRGAPLHFACVDSSGGESEPNLGASVFVLFLVATAAWWALLASLVRWLVAAAAAR
ncbi:MAG: hypothetical protein H5U40_13585 [Polyangiaceae bacterium]|nr:hypothetical protein [Polyangiaceae bacterium]